VLRLPRGGADGRGGPTARARYRRGCTRGVTTFRVGKACLLSDSGHEVKFRQNLSQNYLKDIGDGQRSSQTRNRCKIHARRPPSGRRRAPLHTVGFECSIHRVSPRCCFMLVALDRVPDRVPITNKSFAKLVASFLFLCLCRLRVVCIHM
jgi:hypothetical protein